jgi:hypothetical protein
MYLRACLVAALVAGACGRSGFGEQVDSGAQADARDGAMTGDTPPGIHAIDVTVSSFTATATSYLPVSSLVIPPSPGQTWLVLFSASIETSSLAEIGVEIHYTIGGIERGVGGTQSSAIDRPGPWQHLDVVTGGDTAMPIAIEVRDLMAGKITVRDLHVVAVPMPAAADPLFVADDPVRMISSTTFQPASTFTLPVSGPGDYFVLAVVNASDAPTESDVYVQWNDPITGLHLSDTQQPRTSWQAMFAMWRDHVTAGPLVIKLESKVGGGMSQLEYARVFAMRTDAFATAQFATSPAEVMTTGTAPVPAADLQPVTSGSSFLYVSTMRMAEDCVGMFADRVAHFTVDGNDLLTTDHRAPNCATQATYGTAQLLLAPPSHLTTSVSSGNGLNVYGDEAAILLLDVP